jgi:hypothetical protein
VADGDDGVPRLGLILPMPLSLLADDTLCHEKKTVRKKLEKRNNLPERIST